MNEARSWRGRGRGPVPPSISTPKAATRAESVPDAMRESTLDNGIRVLSEKIPGVRSAAVGVWIRQGAAHETLELTGISHLVEHLVFKGTAKRSAPEIAEALEAYVRRRKEEIARQAA
ncbi:MAG: insulinase family protein [Gemmatimonadetes bacterium]|nr:insulinase family protein [Gemmatimonadota bacterium]